MSVADGTESHAGALRVLLLHYLPRHLLVQPADQRHRSPEVAAGPGVRGAFASAECVGKCGQDARDELLALLLASQRHLVVVADRQPQAL